ncbi:spore coat associated protein CotJA [Alicyclobacillus tolerans]|uniref:Spore coat protein JA n=2 Tax=Alicyclobacillus tolerans TaxID=90970 RepID=A0ABT9LSH0_9BACL|nr:MULTISPECIES: spore coat associated protein CotJA [Alicyclobacillus]MDP9727209.1 spore coat protein JA [Alicyclobacillus tengchongensis]QRF22970.1 spore coat associated protein CotJA [Alicyclobacillus sp. TC]SHJ58447.1 spore coat protein JA [Alicyclobacillus montanus]
MQFHQWAAYAPYRSPYDPCPGRGFVRFVIPPNQWITVQPTQLKQYSPQQALRHGVLWPDLFSPYPYHDGKGGR